MAYYWEAVKICRENGCQLGMVLKDTHTCELPERFERWIAATWQALEDRIQ